jgi:hypothetical protein
VLVSELVDRMRSASQEDPAWFGSEGNRTLLEEFASARAPGAVVRWGASGQRAFASGSELSIEPPVDLPAPYDSLLIHAAMAHHEVLHRVYSDDSGATAMAARLALGRPYLRTLGEQVFNWLEACWRPLSSGGRPRHHRSADEQAPARRPGRDARARGEFAATSRLSPVLDDRARRRGRAAVGDLVPRTSGRRVARPYNTATPDLDQAIEEARTTFERRNGREQRASHPSALGHPPPR